jgi:hypothetical protein
MRAIAGEHPFVTRLRELPQNFPELGEGNAMLSNTARLVILPQMIRAAKKSPDAFRATVVKFIARFVVALDVMPAEIYGEIRKAVPAPAEDQAASPSAPAETPPPDADPPAPPGRPDMAKILAAEN